MLVIDSAGVQSTVSYRAQAVDAIHDAQTTEVTLYSHKVLLSFTYNGLFMPSCCQNWLDDGSTHPCRISHQIVFVVNDLTWFEQKYVAMLHQKYVQCKQHKEQRG